MTKLQAVNTILMYINEKVVTQTQLDAGTIPVITLATTVLDEHIRLHNNITGNTDTDIATVDVLIQDNLVKRASKALFTRHIGFEEKGIDVILFDEKQTMGSVAKFCVNTFFGTGYEYIENNIHRFLTTTDSLETAYPSAELIKGQIDEIISSITALYPFMAGDNLLYTYAMNRVLSEEKSEFAVKAEQDNINSIAKYVYHNLVAQSITYPYVADVLLSMPIEKQNIKNINDIQKNITTVENIFVMSRRKILSYGWYFNTMTLTLVPNTNKYIAIPTSYLSVDDNSSNTHTVRDWKLFNNSELTFLFDDPVECVVIDDVPYDDLQQPYRAYVFADARHESYRSILGLSGSTAEISIENKSLSEARILAVRDDANNQDGNLLTDTYSSTLLDRTSL